MAAHADLTGANLHEPKGVSSAASGTVYQANGSGSGTWAKVGSTNINTSSVFNTNKYHVIDTMVDVSTSSSILLIPCPVACTLTRVTSILHGAIATADAVLTVINSTGTATIGTITIATASSAEGDIDTLDASVNNTFSAGTYCKVTTNGASTNTIKATLLFEFTRTA